MIQVSVFIILITLSGCDRDPDEPNCVGASKVECTEILTTKEIE